MKHHRYNIRFPAPAAQPLDQDEAYFYFKDENGEAKLRFHDYGELYKRPGLYEQLFYERLKCASPEMIADILSKVLTGSRVEMSELRVLDLGAGNGMVGELLEVARVVGVDISPEAFEACERDRPGAYDAYYVTDLCNLDPAIEQELRDWQVDRLTCVAASATSRPRRSPRHSIWSSRAAGWRSISRKPSFRKATFRASHGSPNIC